MNIKQLKSFDCETCPSNNNADFDLQSCPIEECVIVRKWFDFTQPTIDLLMELAGRVEVRQNEVEVIQ